MPETLQVSTLGRLAPGAAVNLEAALRIGDSLGGHVVSGDVEGQGQIIDLENRGNSLIVRIKPMDIGLLRHVVLRGRICIDGASLTVMEQSSEHLAVSLIPHSRQILAPMRQGQFCNLETDLLARHYVHAQKWEVPV
jgi:riboflavin synthase